MSRPLAARFRAADTGTAIKSQNFVALFTKGMQHHPSSWQSAARLELRKSWEGTFILQLMDGNSRHRAECIDRDSRAHVHPGMVSMIPGIAVYLYEH